ncbi:hypothetical protein BDR06DRAFT_998143 [Suillus hirtellus]|nr:hypothetical protein BDR06DRAFT_998143 [Suillus hirtellus]
MMTVLYLVARYLGIGFVVIGMLMSTPTISTTDAVSEILKPLVGSELQYNDSHSCLVLDDTHNWTGNVADAILGVIMIVRLHAMYQRSRKVLIFLVVTFLAIRIASVVMVAMIMTQVSAEGFILYGTYQCNIVYTGDSLSLTSTTWILGTVWEVLALCLAVWIAVKHFRELRRHSTGGIMGDCFTVLMQTHVSYFASFVVIACFQISLLSPTLLADQMSQGVQIYLVFAQIAYMVQLSVLGPRLILSVREYHAKLVADSDTATAMTSIAFQEHIYAIQGLDEPWHEYRSLPNAEVHARDLDSHVMIVAACGSLFAPSMSSLKDSCFPELVRVFDLAPVHRKGYLKGAGLEGAEALDGSLFLKATRSTRNIWARPWDKKGFLRGIKHIDEHGASIGLRSTIPKSKFLEELLLIVTEKKIFVHVDSGAPFSMQKHELPGARQPI